MKGCILYDPIYMKCQEQAIYRDRKISVCLGLSGSGWKVTVNEYKVSFGDDENVLKLHYGHVNFMVCKQYLSKDVKKNELSLYVWVYFWTFFSVLLIYLSVFMLIPCCSDWYSFIIMLEIR